MAIQVDIKDLPTRLGRDMRALQRRAVKVIQDTVRARGPGIAIEVINETQPRPPVNYGRYRGAWRTSLLPNGALFFNPLVYAGVLDKGRRPGSMPPVDALEKWVMRKGIVADARWARRAAQATIRAELPGRANSRLRNRALRETRRRKLPTARQIAFAIAMKMKRDGWPFAPNQPMQISRRIQLRLVPLVRDALRGMLTRQGLAGVGGREV